MRGDHPIYSLEDDTLGRGPTAQAFAEHILSLDAGEGVVVGVLGRWGSGKTSFVNLARLELKKAGVPILDFNPWMFSGAEQLVDSFFVELSAQLKVRPDLADVGKNLEDYGEMFSGMSWVPFLGSWIEGARGVAKLLGAFLQRRKEGIAGRKKKLWQSLLALDKPIVVVLDDIDRLSTREIRDIFKLVRLTASFPQIIYVLAFDRGRVEKALTDEGVPGRDYLEKILQLAIDLPAVPENILQREILKTVDRALGGIEDPGPFDEHAWPDIFMEVIRPLIRNMRDVRRYAAAIRGTVRDLKGQIALTDVLALEAVRVFLPDVFERLDSTIEGLTSTSTSMARGGDDEQLKRDVNALVEAGGEHKDVFRNMIARLFPAGVHRVGGSHFGASWQSRWLRDRRMAHEDVLRLYLERVAGKGLQAFNDAQKAWSLFDDQEKLDRYLRSLPVERLQDVIAALENYEDEFKPQHVVPATTVLLNILPDLPERETGIFEFSTSLVITRVTYRLMKRLGDPAQVEAAAREILPRLKTLSAKLELISDLGYRENQGHKLISEAAAADLEKAWRDEVRAASLDRLLPEKDLLEVLFDAKRHSTPEEPPVIVPAAPTLTLAILKCARHEVKTQTMGNRSIRRTPRLAWDILVELYGNEDVLKRRLEELKGSKPHGVDDLLGLADKYASGWRPRRDED